MLADGKVRVGIWDNGKRIEWLGENVVGGSGGAQPSSASKKPTVV